MSQEPDLRFFTHNWTITLPPNSSSPSLKFKRVTPALTSSYLSVISNPACLDTPNPEARILPPPPTADNMLRRYHDSLTRYNYLEVLISLSSSPEIIGCGQITPIDTEPGTANIGIMLLPSVRGMGVGKLSMEGLLRLSCEMRVDVVEAGTMKGNMAMRGLARSLGFVETEGVKSVEGRGVVAEVLYKNLEREKWRGVEWEVEFEDEAVGGERV